MPDIRDVLKGLSPDDRALYQEVRTAMRRAYLSAHSRTLPIDQFIEEDDAFLDLIDIKLAVLFDRAGVFNHVDGNLNKTDANVTEKIINDQADSVATKLMRRPLQQEQNGASNAAWPKSQ